MLQTRRLWHKVVLLVFTLALMMTSSGLAALSVDAAGGGLSQLTLSNGAKITLEQYHLITEKDKKVLSFAINVKNPSGSKLDFFRDYWFKLANQHGMEYTIRMVDDKKTKVLPGGERTFIFYSTDLPNTETLNNLHLKMVKWDFSQPSLYRNLGVLPFKEMKLNRGTGIKQPIAISSFDQPMEVQVNKALVTTEGDEQLNLVTLEYYNRGNFPLTLPPLQYQLITKQGHRYPYQQESKEITINPGQRVEVEMMTVMDTKASLAGSTFYIMQPIMKSTAVDAIPVGAIALNPKTQTVSKILNNKSYTAMLGEEHQLNLRLVSIQAGQHPQIQLNLQGKGEFGAEQPILLYRWQSSSEWKEVVEPGVVTTEGMQIHLPIPGHLLNNQAATLQLLVKWKQEEQSVQLPLYTLQQQEEALRAYYPDFQIKLDGLMRYPHQTEDMLLAKFILTNTSNQEQDLPAWAFTYQLDGNKEVEAKIKVLEQEKEGKLLPFESVDYYVFGTVDTNHPSEQVTLTMNERFTVGEKHYDFPLQSFNTRQDDVTVGKSSVTSVVVEDGNKKVRQSVQEMRVYEYDNHQLLAVKLTSENIGSRYFNDDAGVAFFQAPGGYIFPAKADRDGNWFRTPLQKDLIVYTALVPKNVKTTGMQFVLGQKVWNDDDHALVDNFQRFAFTKEKPSGDSTEVSLYPYKLSFSNFGWNLANKDEITYQFHFERERLEDAVIVEKLPKVRVEVRRFDEDGPLLYSSDISLTADGGTEDESKRTVTNTILMHSHVKNYGDVLMKGGVRIDGAYLYIYEVWEDGKHLLVEKSLF